MTQDELEAMIRPLCVGISAPAFEALVVLLAYGTTDGGHHKMWVIDQAVQLIAGDQYTALIELYEAGDMYDWDKGVAP